jgi:CDP-glucose 4,6-dehydratase
MVETDLFKAYRDKKVLVTGHTGFKGSWLSIWLNELGAKVIGYSLKPHTEPNNFSVSGLEDKITHLTGDIKDSKALHDVFEKYEPDIVMHLAAQAIVRASYDDPKDTFDTNVGGTVNVFEAVRKQPGVKALINVTSDKCYENREWVWGYRENDPMGGYDPYSASKGCAELVFASYNRSFFNNKTRKTGVASVRAGNVIGGGDWAADRLIPDFVRALDGGRAMPVRSPFSIRPWQHVLEPLSGYLTLGALLLKEPERFSGGWNFGPDESEQMNVREVIEEFIKVWGGGSWQDLSDPSEHLHEAATLRLCCDKAKNLLKWHAVLNIEDCLRMTAEWYKEYYSTKNNMYQKCARQIEFYTERARECRLSWAA